MGLAIVIAITIAVQWALSIASQEKRDRGEKDDDQGFYD